MGFSMRLMDSYVFRPYITEFSDGWKLFEGESEPTDGTLEWTAVDFEARGWGEEQDGFGYDTNETDNVLPYVNTELIDMQGIFSSLYIRKPFTVDNVDEIGELQLTIDYDDAFIAYINGTEVVRVGAAGDVDAPVPFDTFGTSHESTNANGNPPDLFTISLNDFPELLSVGSDNVLAIHGLNQAIDSSDFLLGRIGLAGVEGAPAGAPGDFDANGVLDAADIDALTTAVRDGNNPAEFDLTGDGEVNEADRAEWVNVIKNTYFGDSNMDGEFGTPDFVAVFTAGEYEDTTPGNSTWATGDWNGDGDFGTPDFVAAFSAGGYEKGPRDGGPNVAAVPEPSAIVLLVAGLVMFGGIRRR